MQLNGINLQPKIGTNPTAQYGEGNNINGVSTMVNADNPSAQNYNNGRVNPNSNPEKIAEEIAKYETAQGDYMKMYHGL